MNHPENLRSLGILPFAYGYTPTHTVGEARGLAVGTSLALAGRIIALRRHGRLAFADLADSTGFIQVMLRANVLVEGGEILAEMRLGDFIGVEGELTHTQAGELSVAPRQLRLLSAAVISPPFALNPRAGFAGVNSTTPDSLTDPEARARQRYLDLAVHRDVLARFRARSEILRAIRGFLDNRRYQEVETPVLQPLYGGAQARPFTTHYHSLDEERYLRIAPELYLRRLLVGGMERVYEVARCFRNEGLDRTHTPEFTMLEAYEAYADYNSMMNLVEELLSVLAEPLTGSGVIEYQGQSLDFSTPLARLDFSQALSEAVGFNILDASDDDLARALPEGDRATGRAELLDGLFGHYVEPNIIQPTFVINHPLVLSPLARTHREDGRLAERFELYLGGMEVANAYTELCDPSEIRERLQSIRAESGHIDEDFVRASEYGLPPSAGLGIGLDRLVMVLTNTAHIRDVQLFPPMRRGG